jgi:hypothetical protein
MLLGQKKLLDLRCCEFVLVSNSKVCRCKGAIGVEDDFGSAFILCDSMHRPTCFGGIIRNASNMPKFLVHVAFLYIIDTTEIYTSGREWWNLEHCRGGLLDDGR